MFAHDIERSNELIFDKVKNAVVNLLDRNKVGDAVPDATKEFYKPCVTIPVDGMNVSEPPWGWSPREVEAAQIEAERKQFYNPGTPYAPRILGYYPAKANGEGRYFAPSDPGNIPTYDVPFDTAPELVRTGTTANYRTIHLQRLANPLLPWNPPPGQFYDSTDDPTNAATHAQHDMHKPNLPVNPYLTVDTSSVDLTAFNGVSNAEGNYQDRGGPGQPNPPGGGGITVGKTVQSQLGQFRPWVPVEANDFKTNMQQKGSQVFHFKSLERGAYGLLSTTHLIRDYTTPANTNDRLLPFPQRLLPAHRTGDGHAQRS